MESLTQTPQVFEYLFLLNMSQLPLLGKKSEPIKTPCGFQFPKITHTRAIQPWPAIKVGENTLTTLLVTWKLRLYQP